MAELLDPAHLARAAEPAPYPVTPGRAWRLVKRVGAGLLMAVAAVAAAWFGYHYWTIGRFLVATNDAYLKADYTAVAPKVAGIVAEVLVADNQVVAAGEILARIDDRDFRTALEQARAEIAAADAALRNYDAQIELQYAAIDQSRATVAATQATLTFTMADAARYRDLVKTGAGTVQRAQQTVSARDQALAQLRRDAAAVTAAERKVAVLASARDQAVAQRQRSLALAQQAALNLSYATVAAPVAGTIGARSIRVGQYVSPGTHLMAVVPLDAVYVVANYKETQLTRVAPGQPVRIAVDGFPDTPIVGRVDSVAPASGLEFALLPPDNATGNFTKIVQRVPVRIALDPGPLAGRLRAGMSVEPEIDTRAPGHTQEAAP